MSKAPSFQWYPKDCDTDENVRAMDDREFGFYMRCLNHAWLNGGLPADLADLSRIMGRQPAYTRKVWARVGRCFTPSGDRWVNPRQEEQRRRAVEYADSMKEAGARGAAKRWKDHKPSDSQANSVATDTPIASDSSASPSASPTAKPEKHMCSSNDDEHFSLVSPAENTDPQAVWFSEFWSLYWRKRAKKAALAAFRKKIKTLGTWEIVKAALLRQEPGMLARDPETRPHAATWLNGERWNDEDELPTEKRSVIDSLDLSDLEGK